MELERIAAALAEAPYRILDILPEQVPENAEGQYFAAERYWRQPERLSRLYRSFGELLLRLNCYDTMAVSFDAGEHWEQNPEPETYIHSMEGLSGGAYLRVLFPARRLLLDLDPGDTWMTVYGECPALLEKLAAGVGLFLWEPEITGKEDLTMTERNEETGKQGNGVPFCTCTDTGCPCHPVNHDRGCTLCVAKNLKQREIPSCFFHAAGGEKPTPDWHFEDFAALMNENAKKQPELWDAYDADCRKLEGVTLVRGEDDRFPPGVYHLVCEILVRHEDGSYLLMQRDPRKPFGGMWEASAGGSALRGETPLVGAIRELREETGIDAERITEVGRLVSGQYPAIYVEYLCETDWEKDRIVLQEGETVAYRWVDRETLLGMPETELLTTRVLRYIDELRI